MSGLDWAIGFESTALPSLTLTARPKLGTPLPVVVSVVPVVKVHQKTAVHHVGHTGHADKGWVHAIDSLQLHAHLEAQGWGFLKGKKRGCHGQAQVV